MHEHEKRALNLDQVRDYVSVAAQRAEEQLPIMRAASWRCVDGRYEARQGYAGPGGALGAVLALCAGLETVCLATDRQLPDAKEVYTLASDVLGGLSGHTDNHQPEAAWRCAGCGHCAGALRTPADFGISAYAPALYELTQADQTLDITTLSGRHQEGAVLLVSNEVQMPGRRGQASALVFHPQAWDELLEGLAAAAAERFSLERKQLTVAVQSAGQHQLQLTLKRLANGLPTYAVSGEGDQLTVTAL